MNYKTTNLKAFLTLIITFVALLTIPACYKPYIGYTVDRDAQYCCIANELPTACSTIDNGFAWRYTITRGKDPGSYILEGTADGSVGEAKSIGTIDTSHSKFWLLLINDSTVVETVSFLLSAKDIIMLNHFKREFVTDQPFDAATITWEVHVRG